jgi:hypothetical protein
VVINAGGDGDSAAASGVPYCHAARPGRGPAAESGEVGDGGVGR